jgi:hypothetical protein
LSNLTESIKGRAGGVAISPKAMATLK